MSRGSFEIIKTKSPSIFAYVREYGNSKYIIVHNLSKEKQKIEIDIPACVVDKDKDGCILCRNMLDNKRYKFVDKQMHLVMPSYATMWLMCK